MQEIGGTVGSGPRVLPRSLAAAARTPVAVLPDVRRQRAQAIGAARPAAERALELHQVLHTASVRDRAQAYALEVEQDARRRRGASAHQHVHVLEVAVVDAGGVQPAEERAER